MNIFKFVLFSTLFVSYSFGMAPADKQLYQAAFAGNQDRVQELIKQGANVNTRSPGGLTPLYSAVLKGHDNVVELLINAKANVNIATNENVTPLHFAQTARTARMLLEAGANINARDNLQRTPLDAAIKNDNIAVARILFDRNADFTAPQELAPGRRTTQEDRLLQQAIEQGAPKIARFAIERGAFIDPNYVALARNKFNAATYPLDKERYKAIGRILLDYFAIVGQQGGVYSQIAKKGFAIPDLPTHIQEIIARHFAT